MRQISFVLGLGTLAVALWGCASPTAKSDQAAPAVAATQQSEDVESAIISLEKQWTEAIVKNDTTTIDSMLAKDFAGTSPTAHSYTKSDAIDDLKTGRYKVKSMDMDEVSANIYGDTAVAFVSQEEKSTYEGKDISGHYHYTDVWVKRDGKWQAVASHGSRYDKALASEAKKN